VEQSKYVQEPQHHSNDHHCVQDRLDTACHGDETIHQPQKDTNDDQHNYHVNQGHDPPLSLRKGFRLHCYRTDCHFVVRACAELERVGTRNLSPVEGRRMRMFFQLPSCDAQRIEECAHGICPFSDILLFGCGNLPRFGTLLQPELVIVDGLEACNRLRR
jgi:hypothetical protein